MLKNTSTSDTSLLSPASGGKQACRGVHRAQGGAYRAKFLKDFELEAWGEGELAYIKQLKAKDVAELFPQLGGLPEGIDLYAVVSADGTPMVLTDSRVAALENVEESDLELVTLH